MLSASLRPFKICALLPVRLAVSVRVSPCPSWCMDWHGQAGTNTDTRGQLLYLDFGRKVIR